ncbi:MAG TPA: hypothetical protein VGL58_16935 [Caulobacteraceae bacterium]
MITAIAAVIDRSSTLIDKKRFIPTLALRLNSPQASNIGQTVIGD